MPCLNCNQNKESKPISKVQLNVFFDLAEMNLQLAWVNDATSSDMQIAITKLIQDIQSMKKPLEVPLPIKLERLSKLLHLIGHDIKPDASGRNEVSLNFLRLASDLVEFAAKAESCPNCRDHIYQAKTLIMECITFGELGLKWDAGEESRTVIALQTIRSLKNIILASIKRLVKRRT